MRGHSLPINKLTFSPSGRQLITVSNDQKVKVWSGDLGEQVQRARGRDFGAATAAAFGAITGEQVAVGYHLGDVRVFDVTSGALEN